MKKKKNEPMVSILCTTYNHADFIRQAIDSMLAQQTEFAFEILINDDHSSDGTTEIIKEYQQKHPQIIKPVFHEENLYSKGVRSMAIRYLLPHVKGEYIALCEGDDYWIDERKLQKQVDYMEKHPECTVCFHPVKVVFENKEQGDTIFPEQTAGFTLHKLLEGNYIQTNSVMYRRQNYDDITQGIMPADWYLHLYHARFGKIGFINEVMAVYRRHSGGLWWDAHSDRRKFWEKYGPGHMELYKELLKMYGDTPAYRQAIASNIVSGAVAIVESSRSNTLQIPGVLLESSELIGLIIEEVNRSKKAASDVYETEIERLNTVVRAREEELTRLKASRTWKIRTAVVNIVDKIRAR